jgi:hypothetical protein
MNRAQHQAAREQQARSRAVHGWAFRGLPDSEAAEIRAFLAGGPCPPQHREVYDLCREQLGLDPEPGGRREPARHPRGLPGRPGEARTGPLPSRSLV